MRTLDRSREVVELGARLGVPTAAGAVSGVVSHCRACLEECVRSGPDGRSIEDVERLVCERLRLTIEEVWSGAGLGELVRRYAAAGEPVFAYLPDQFDDLTFAALIRLRGGSDESPRHVAVVDCRGPKAHRRFFSRWHEIAHLMTLPPTAETPVHRSRHDRSAIERLMDIIAAELGFYDPLFRPLVAAEARMSGGLTFAGVERVRRAFSPTASYEATLSACVSRVESPLVLVEAGLALSGREERQFETEPVPSRRPKPQMRALKAIHNEAARNAAFALRPRMKIPAASQLYGLFFGRGDWARASEVAVFEDAGIWRDAGAACSCARMSIQACDRRDRVLALLSPAADDSGQGRASCQ